jgi:hypothetical protein
LLMGFSSKVVVLPSRSASILKRMYKQLEINDGPCPYSEK